LSKYPTEEALSLIKNWDEEDFSSLAVFICSVWNSDYGSASLTGKRVKTLRLATGGWSGNEDIVTTLQETMFAKVCWQVSKRGGLYIYKIPGKIKGEVKGGFYKRYHLSLKFAF
jgi:hypothetical protein